MTKAEKIALVSEKAGRIAEVGVEIAYVAVHTKKYMTENLLADFNVTSDSIRSAQSSLRQQIKLLENELGSLVEILDTPIE